MKTEKLYYTDAYISSFEAKVASVEACENGYAVVLDRTAFFPEEGGQHADSGVINGISVKNVFEKDGVIYHLLDQPLEIGSCAVGELDFAERFDKMQQHSAEHLASGIIHSLYGAENVGFHLGPDEVTFDTDLPLTREELDKVEELVNIAIYENRKIKQSFPDSSQLSELTYRSKLELTEDVRIVTIEGYDDCACCAPHVSFTGEIGVVKFIYSEKHKGGTRVYMAAGKRAYEYFGKLYKSAMGISQLLSVPVTDIAEEVLRLNESKVALEFAISEKGKAMARVYADSLPESNGNLTLRLPYLDPSELREFANLTGDKIKGILIALSGEDGNYKYVIKSHARDVSEFIKDANSALCGRGGGRGAMAQGSFAAAFSQIKDYFDNLT